MPRISDRLKKKLAKRVPQGVISKYGNKRGTCLSKHKHDSMVEAAYCNRLMAMQQGGEILAYEVQSPMPLKGIRSEIALHVVDFMVVFKNGKHEAHEVKGHETDVWKLKRRLFEDNYPDIPYVVIKGKAGKGGYEWKISRKESKKSRRSSTSR